MRATRRRSMIALFAGIVSGLALTALWLQATPARAQTDPTVTLAGLAYQPAAVTVTLGSTVTWTHADGFFVHTVTADGGAFSSLNLAEGDLFTQTFTTTSVYSYHCLFHPGMVGVVTVVDLPEHLYLPALGRDG